VLLKSVPPQIMKNVCLCSWVNESPHRTAKLCITIFIQICKFLTTSLFKMYVWSLNSTTLLLKQTKEKQVWITVQRACFGWAGGILFAKVTIFWRKTKTQSHMSPHIVQTMISYCSPELDRILLKNLLCCLTSSLTWLIHLADNLCVPPSTYLPKLKKRNPWNPWLPKPFQAETDLLTSECGGTHEQVYGWWMVCGQETLFHHIHVW